MKNGWTEDENKFTEWTGIRLFPQRGWWCLRPGVANLLIWKAKIPVIWLWISRRLQALFGLFFWKVNCLYILLVLFFLFWCLFFPFFSLQSVIFIKEFNSLSSRWHFLLCHLSIQFVYNICYENFFHCIYFSNFWNEKYIHIIQKLKINKTKLCREKSFSHPCALPFSAFTAQLWQILLLLVTYVFFQSLFLCIETNTYIDNIDVDFSFFYTQKV